MNMTVKTNESGSGPVSPIEGGTAYRATITRVIDGDTFEVEFADGKVETIQLIGVDAPETVAINETPSDYDIPNSSHGHDWLLQWDENAKLFVKNNTTDRQVLVVTDPISETRDESGYLLAHVYYGANQNTSLGHALLERGLARQRDNATYTLKYKYEQFEQDAQTADRGLWAFEAVTSTPVLTPAPILAPTPTPTPTSTTDQTPTLTPEPTPAPTLTQTGISTPTQTETSTSTQIETPTPALTPTPTPTPEDSSTAS